MEYVRRIYHDIPIPASQKCVSIRLSDTRPHAKRALLLQPPGNVQPLLLATQSDAVGTRVPFGNRAPHPSSSKLANSSVGAKMEIIKNTENRLSVSEIDRYIENPNR